MPEELDWDEDNEVILDPDLIPRPWRSNQSTQTDID